jgi:hypothetical protein
MTEEGQPQDTAVRWELAISVLLSVIVGGVLLQYHPASLDPPDLAQRPSLECMWSALGAEPAKGPRGACDVR